MTILPDWCVELKTGLNVVNWRIRWLQRPNGDNKNKTVIYFPMTNIHPKSDSILLNIMFQHAYPSQFFGIRRSQSPVFVGISNVIPHS